MVPTRSETKSLVRICGIAAATAGIGAQVARYARTGNVATLTTGAAHGLSAGDAVLVVGVGSGFDGYVTLTAASGTSLSYANTGAEVVDAALLVTAGVSKRCAIGRFNWKEAENFAKSVKTLTAQTAGYFWAALSSISSEGQNFEKRYALTAQLVVYAPKHTNSDLVAAWEFVLGLRDQIETLSRYGAGEYPPQLTVTLREHDDDHSDDLLIFDIGSGAGSASGLYA